MTVTWDQRAEDLAYADREVERVMAMSDEEIQRDAEFLLEWMTGHSLPLHLYRETDEDGGNWVVVDASTNQVLGSGGSAHDALIEANRQEGQSNDA